RTPSHKVIALDCDQTMWKGVCGEDGPHGIEIDPPRQALQEFMRRQHDTGMLICLCSKNNEEDVVKVFEQRAEEMPIKREHVVDWRLNWGFKSENLKSLAGDLRLGLDSFIFVDDDPVACAEVRANCPEVLTLQLPQEVSSFSQFLNHIWNFDRLNVTGEDEKRTALYKQNAARERLRKGTLSFDDFLADLNLEIRISEMRPEHLARVSQLTHRTNQFNFTTVRRSEGEIQALCLAGETECLVVEVSDRFGDYGLVGVILFRAGGEAVNVDTFLLSCRALGRGVEHRMLARLGEIAKERGLSRVGVEFITSGKNRPAHDFLNGVGADFKQPIEGGYSYSFPSEFAEATVYRPANAAALPIIAVDSADKPPAPFIPAAHDGGGSETKSALMSRIATELCTVEQILNAVEDKKRRTRPKLAGTYVAPRTPTEEILAGIWAQTLGVDGVGVNDDFFQLGGHSLLGTLLMSRVCTTFQIDLSLGELFAAPTVAGLARVVQQNQIEQVGAQEIIAALGELGELTDEEVAALLAADEDAETDQEGDGAYPLGRGVSEGVRR
ncbi:MAG: HAD-IIIC family phosphatase, partial [Pyrinomonadaceae bacterium]|nr:HAD-IIIC family phosphatase [Pyrinomonadaceae bacterium]